MVQTETGTDRQIAPRSRTSTLSHITFLDGIRGVTALYVAVYHAAMWRNDRPFNFGPLNSLPLNFGHAAVCVFIVLSGFCLGISPSRRQGALQPFASYMRRRAWRILPPYYAALALSLLVVGSAEALRLRPSSVTDALPVTTAGVVSHVLLIHNWSWQWTARINGPMWSIAVEWQLYWLFPLMILSIYRFGFIRTLVPCLIIGSGLHFIPGSPLDHTVPWYLALFGFGAAAAVLTYDPSPRFRRICDRTPWGALAIVALLATACARIALPRLIHVQGDAGYGLRFVTDPLLGLAVAPAIVWLARRPATGPGHWMLAILEWRPLVQMGIFSYSLYLLHRPLVDFAGRALDPLLPWQSRDAAFAVMMLGVMPAIVAFAYGFHRLFERPFMRHTPAG